MLYRLGLVVRNNKLLRVPHLSSLIPSRPKLLRETTCSDQQRMAGAAIKDALMRIVEEEAAAKHEAREYSKEQIQSADPKIARKALKHILTQLQFDPSEEFMQMTDSILMGELGRTEVYDSAGFPQAGGVAIWRGDISTLKVDAIVNAANSAMLGCFQPDHACIDNVIHCKAGPRLRADCRVYMEERKEPEPTGSAVITKAYCLPSKWVLHTVGPIISEQKSRMGVFGKAKGGTPTKEDEALLASCYRKCLTVAANEGARSVAFCCISTGVFGYPNEPAAKIACSVVKEWLGAPENAGKMDLVVFNTYLEKDQQIYEHLVPKYFGPLPQAPAPAAGGKK